MQFNLAEDVNFLCISASDSEYVLHQPSAISFSRLGTVTVTVVMWMVQAPAKTNKKMQLPDSGISLKVKI